MAQSLSGTVPRPLSASEIRHALKGLPVTASVLYIAAHPDDENTRLLTWLANEKHYYTGYLSITRGDGGQNLIGPEQGDALGVIRTQELLGARQIDGAVQYFTRARDFGYSKTSDETLGIWDRDSILSDVVWVIRKHRPDVIICRFPPDERAGHGHHAASAILAKEAFEAAGDPERFPWQLEYLQVWKPTRIVWNAYIRGGTVPDHFVPLIISAYNPLLGKYYGELAAASRSMHKSQGFGASANRGQVTEQFEWVAGAPMESSPLSGVESLVRERSAQFPAYSKAVRELSKKFRDEDPSTLVPQLLIARSAAQTITDPFWRERKVQQLDQLIAASLGLWAQAESNMEYLVPGQEAEVEFSVIRQGSVPVGLERLQWNTVDSAPARSLEHNVLERWTLNSVVPAQTAYSSPYWLNLPGTQGRFGMPEHTTATAPWNGPAQAATVHLNIAGQPWRATLPLTYKLTHPVRGELNREAAVVPALVFAPGVQARLFKPGESRSIEVQARTLGTLKKGRLMARVPQGWSVSPAFYEMDSLPAGQNLKRSFIVGAPADFDPNTQNRALYLQWEFHEMSGEHPHVYTQEWQELDHEHIPQTGILNLARVRLTLCPHENAVQVVGYLPGAGDAVPEALEELGVQVKMLNMNSLTKENLWSLKVLVLGVRAYNTYPTLREKTPMLLDWVKEGGRLIVQYNTNSFIGSIKESIGPYPFTISRDRVSVEEAPVEFLLPNHPVLNYPNKLSPQDFEGWVQERGIYFARDMAPEYSTPLQMTDPGEDPTKGALLIAEHGKGTYIYTGLSLFRQLPAGVPGAYRLLANLINP